MERFYDTWLAQPISDPALALRQTKLAYITSANPAERDPAAWAPSSSSKGEASRRAEAGIADHLESRNGQAAG